MRCGAKVPTLSPAMHSRQEERGHSILKKRTANTSETVPRQPHGNQGMPRGVGSPLATHPGNNMPMGNRRWGTSTDGFPGCIETVLYRLRQQPVTLKETRAHTDLEGGSAYTNAVTSPEEFQIEIHSDCGRTCLTTQTQELQPQSRASE